MGKSILEVITEYAVNERIGQILWQDEEYKQIQDKISSLTSELDVFDLSKNQRLAVEQLISFYNEDGALYGRKTYQKGFKDCVAFLVEIGLIKYGKEFREDGKIGTGHRVSE